MAGNRLNIGLQTKLAQKLLITPQMKQSLTILQMPITELVQEINAILEANPVLEESHDSPDNDNDFDDIPDSGELDTVIADDLIKNLSSSEWDDYIGEHDDLSFRPSDEEGVDYDKFVRSRDNIFDHLMYQLRILGLSTEEERIGEYIIGNLDSDGYFRSELSSIAEELTVQEQDVSRMLSVVQTFDPAGIASRTLRECIETQLTDFGAEQVYIDLIGEFFELAGDDIKSYDLHTLREKIGVEEDTFDYMLFLIRKCDPRPGASFSSGPSEQITPDAFIVRKNNQFEVILNEEGMPAIRLNSYYLRMMKSLELDPTAREYIEDKVKNAVWLLKSLHKRQKAIFRVLESIVEYQNECLAVGMHRLRPLRLKDIAEKTGLHESTVSRVTSGKYAMTPHGIIEIKAFFVKGLETEDGDMSTLEVKDKIKELIESEPKDKPYSDQQLVDILDKKGIKIARRTVAKYRDELNIPTKSDRKKTRR